MCLVCYKKCRCVYYVQGSKNSPARSQARLLRVGHTFSPQYIMLSSTRPQQLPSPDPSSPPSIMTDVRRRLSSRRGSMSASDPFGIHAEAETARSTSARLTIVRVPGDPTMDSGMPTGPPSRPESLRRGSGGSTHSTSSSIGGSAPGSGGRMSFAFSTFTPINKDASQSSKADHRGSPPPSPQLSRRHRSGSNTSINERPFRDSFYGRQASLTPAQIYDLAVSATKPPPLTPGGGKSQPGTPGTVASAFTPLPEDHFLPFLDRAAEVSALLSKPPTNRLIALLAQTFADSSRGRPKTASGKAPEHTFDISPAKWNFEDLEAWLKTVDRDQADDREWVWKARQCVRSRSELIWERLKGALGVPPDFDEEFADEENGGRYRRGRRQ